ncbi:Protein MANNAN SYNTHESIS-RELATED 1 [Camellia lanceoleosa]|uniref:Protein MANNAN SYNTHESIS-RELATED 1 n=1 Tax=Camellia lanceoleosa TaxID=1840588 RepID=A0ACC0HQW6_9ERIC|nr:Protein MANNAN SYNTHESIS-RELATED 1 [Camellia lanceoleosa]
MLSNGVFECDPNWANNRQRLADCAIRLGQAALGGKGVQICVVTDSSDHDPANPTLAFDDYSGSVPPSSQYLNDSNPYEVKKCQLIVVAVVVAKYLGAILVLPDIKGTNPAKTRKLGEIYQVMKFVRGLDGKLRIAKDQPIVKYQMEISPTVRVPNRRISQGYIAENIKPLFKREGNLRITTDFPSSSQTMMNAAQDDIEHLNSLSCLAMFGTLELESRVLRALSKKSNGQFIAVDLKVEMLEWQECRESGASSRKWCCNAEEIGEFLNKIGFHRDTTIYLTQPGWHSNLDPLRHIYPNTFSKEAIMPVDKKARLLKFEKVINFHVCSESDAFVPSVFGMFYTNVVGRRIASGKTQIYICSFQNNFFDIFCSCFCCCCLYFLLHLQKEQFGLFMLLLTLPS